MTENAGLIKSVVESDPWQKYGFTGQLFSIIGVLSYLGVGFAGLEIGHTSAHAPLLIIIIGGVYLFISFKLKQKKDIAKEDRRKSERPKFEMTPELQEFLDHFRDGFHGKIAQVDIGTFNNPADKNKTKAELEEALNVANMQVLTLIGKSVPYGGVHYTREGFEQSQRDMTVIGG